jgi:phage-related protein
VTNSIYQDVQALEPGAEVVLLELDGTIVGGSLIRFHGYTQIGALTW